MNEARTKAVHDLLVTMELGVLDTLRLPKNDVKGSWLKQSDAELFKGMMEEHNEVIDALVALKHEPLDLTRESAELLDHLQLELRDKLVTTAFLYERVKNVMRERGLKVS
jgi:phosphoribosyl-ATP pyrophosphohydrolase